MDESTRDLIVALSDRGAAIVLSLVDDSGRPAITRGWGVDMLPAGGVGVCVAVSSGSPAWDDVRMGQRVAMTMVDPTSYRSMQVKGTIDTVRAVDEDDSRRAATHAVRFGELCEVIGLLGTECMLLDHLLTIEFTVAEGFDQTPGANAGKALT